MSCCEGSEWSRREILRSMGIGFGWLAFRGLAADEVAAAPRRPQEAPADPLAPKEPHFAARAKRVIMLTMAGGPSHVDTFDWKPALAQNDGKAMPGRGRGGARALPSPWAFKQHGQSGLWISELFPELARQADKLCLLRGMHTDVPAHPQAFLKLHTGSFQFVRPSVGAWVLYGLGTLNRNLPGFITINPPANQGGAQNYGSGFLPAIHQGLRVGSDRGGVLRRGGGGGMANIRNPELSAAEQKKQLDLVQRLNQAKLRRDPEHAGVEGVVESYELAFRMQAEVPELMDLDKESKATRDAYGIGAGDSDGFGRQCLMARRFAEAGVRFIEVTQGGWDHHRNLREDLAKSCRAVDKPIAALLGDLEKRGLLKDTLVVWGGEFGRTPYAQGDDGRDHNNKGYAMWMAGGGTKAGFSYGATDDFGAEAVEGRMSLYDLHATVLHLLGLDHEKLTFRYAGRDFRLTDVHGSVATDVIA